MKTEVTQTANKLTFARTFDASRELVFRAFSNAEHIKQWWGPKDWPVTKCNLDFRVDGVWHYCMQGPDGGEHWSKAVYREITEPARIVYTDSFADATGNPTNEMPPRTVTILFDEMGDKTRVTTSIVCETEEEIRAVMALGMVSGYGSTLDNLETYLYKLKQ